MDELHLDIAEWTDLEHWRWRLTEAGGAFLADHAVALDRADAESEAFANLHFYLRYPYCISSFEPSCIPERTVVAIAAHE